jgi:hypothetical protein
VEFYSTVKFGQRNGEEVLVQVGGNQREFKRDAATISNKLGKKFPVLTLADVLDILVGRSSGERVAAQELRRSIGLPGI